MRGEAQYLWQHDCEKPDMIVKDAVYKKNGFWKQLFTGRTKELVEPEVYESRQVRWFCPDCESEWEWVPVAFSGFWRAKKRTQKWRKYNG